MLAATPRAPEHDLPRRIGDFEVDLPLGEGGMGVVLRARHARSGAAVAIKLVAPGLGDRARSARRFRDEVRAVARLDHPHVVRIHDFGEHVEAGGAPRPYLVMELCTGGTLDVAAPWTFGRFRAAMRDVLGALAHAHARGVVHRDLKPANVLFGATSDARPGLKLIDFGLAYVGDGTGREVAGTPRYMAPEQFRGDRRDIGPGTDLYALGCIAYEIAAGRPPFRGGSAAELAAAHGSATPPPLAPRFAVPAGLEPWILRLLEKDPRRRYAHAADAALGLDDLGEELERHAPRSQRTSHDPCESITRTAPDVDPSDDTDLAPSADVSAVTRRVGTWDPSDARPPAVARGLRAPPVASRDVALGDELAEMRWTDAGADDPLGLGLGLYALRGLPLVGRRNERGLLWSALERTAERHRAHLVVVRGAEGLGKSRLVQWLAERATELGVAHVLRASCTPSSGPEDGLRGMVARAMKLDGLDRDAVLRRLAVATDGGLAPHELAVLGDLVAPGEDRRRTEPTQRHEAIRRLVACIARDRPAVVALDDALLDTDALDFARHVLALGDDPQRILVVVTAEPEMRASRPSARSGLETLLAHPDAELLDLTPLPGPDHARLVQRLLRLAPSTASQIETLTSGNPSFAIALLGAWIDAGILAATDAGFELRDVTACRLPPSLAAAWSERIEQLLARESLAARQAAELAAACGRVVHADEWLEACRAVGADVAIADRLIAARLARPLDGDDFELEDGLAVEALRESAARHRRLRDHARLLASVLEARPPTLDRTERRGRLGLDAGDVRAFEPLRTASAERRRRGELARALELADLAERALHGGDVPETDSRWGDLLVERMATLARMGALGAAEDVVSRALVAARRHGWDHVLPEALWADGTIAGQRGRYEASRSRLAEAADVFAARGDRPGEARALRGLVHVERMTGHLDRAEAHLARWRRAVEDAHDEEEAGWAHQAEGTVAAARGRHDRAARELTQALACMDAAGSSFGRALCLNTAADLARKRGDHDAADALYGEALALASSLGMGSRHVVRLNLALHALERGRHAEAEEQLRRCLRAAASAGQAILDVGARAGLLYGAAATGEGGSFREHVEALEGRPVGALDRETVGWITRAAEAARRRGHDEAADRIGALAAKHTR